MNSEIIKALLADSSEVRKDALAALNSGSDAEARATNRVAIAVTLLADAVLGIQLEGATVREAMAKSMEDGAELTPKGINELLL